MGHHRTIARPVHTLEEQAIFHAAKVCVLSLVLTHDVRKGAEALVTFKSLYKKPKDFYRACESMLALNRKLASQYVYASKVLPDIKAPVHDLPLMASIGKVPEHVQRAGAEAGYINSTMTRDDLKLLKRLVKKYTDIED